MRHLPLAFALLAVCAVPAHAQLPKGLGNVLGGGLPSVGGASANNITGVLGYCLKNKLLGSGGGGAQGLLGQLTGKPGVAESADYKAGLDGRLLTGKGQGTALGSLTGGLKTQMCDAVLNQAKTLI